MRALLLLFMWVLSQQPQKGVIEVNVSDSATGQPVPGANITSIFFQTPPPNVVTSTEADDNGRAVFSDIAFGRYSVTAKRDGYVDAGPTPLGQNFTIDGQSPKHTVNITLTRGAVISGHVVDSKGRPLARAEIQILRKAYRDGHPQLLMSARAETDDRGQYRIVSVAPGEYFLQATLRPTATAAQDKYPRVSYHPGTLDLARASPIRVNGAADFAAIDVVVPDIPVFAVSGTVTNAVPGGRLLANGQRVRVVASFFIGPRDTSTIEQPILVTNRTYSSQPNDTDRTPFELTGFAPGSYYLYPIIDADSATFLTRRTAIDITDRNIEGLAITIPPAPDMKGRIIVEGDASAVNLGSFRVGVRWKENLPSLVGIRTSVTTVDAQTGEFALKSMAEALFTPLITGLPPDAYVADLRQGSRNAYAEGVINSSGAGDVIEITINPKGGTIQGIARNANQEAVRNAGVVLVPDTPRRGNSLLHKRVTADVSGKFTIRGVAPGSYKLFAWPSLPEGGAEESADFLTPFEARGTPVIVQMSGPMNVDVPVIGK
jgi:hypothetical protein